MTDTVHLHFAHANGFPAGSYRRLLQELPDNIQVWALDKFGHNPAFPVARDWLNQARELWHYLDQHTQQPVFLVGHSFGAVVSYLAASERPERCRGLIMLDPPLVTGLTRHVFKLFQRTPLIDKVTPAGKASVRNTQWAPDTDLVEYFAGKGLFQGMEPACIADYVSSATTHLGDKQTLTFDHQVEAELFRTVPTNLPRHYGRYKGPGVVITGELTEVCKPALINPFIKGNGFEHRVFAGGGHMFPLQQPDNVAELLQYYINRWSQASTAQ
ncbi:alpha/beta hydrolase [Aestuariibacter halophilus]|uniref:Alpha/beta hydrolase n=1 Tax=Fluctibacter halophilus TaxID=226011 RepID=A0ABS8G5Q0_9ALTE|nr:alpha/beta hydrolase [Aestuariibacter halophilus]MCC2615850.1 alpha/beta hydrolase [Aestuariibacter halophilus]